MNYKKDFPIFTERPDLIYFDNGATSQKPQVVIDAMSDFYRQSNSNIHRGPHFLAEEATILYEDARRTVADFIGARDSKEIIFTKNATEAINLMAHSFGSLLNAGDVVVLSKLEHHANIVPWLQLKERIGIELRYFDIAEDGFIKFDPELIDERVKLVSVSGMSNAFGTITDLPPIIKAAHEVGAKVLVDAAQLAVHRPINVHQLDIDFLVFTGHKLYGPTGIGVLYGKEALLNQMPPFLGGGDMVNEVTIDRFSPAELPHKFEAGTPNISGAIGLKAAIDYVNKIGFTKIQKLENELADYLLKKLNELPYLIGPKDGKNRGSIVAFHIEGVHPHDVAEGLSQKNICIRAGQHCTQPLHDACDLPATARASLAFYNTKEEIDRMVEVLDEIYKYFH
ncbi:cysteine desulfurase [Candidatus Pacearchaeota archaeon]|nr:cysteine desulfurase [Candidatus Pacearchaeota archaeon]